MGKICIVTPGHLAANPRVIKEADALTAAGHRVSVISGDYSEWARSVEGEFSSRTWHHSERVRFGPDAPLLLRLCQAARYRAVKLLWSESRRSEALDCAACHPAGPDLSLLVEKTTADLYVAHYVAALPAVMTAARRHRALFAFDAEDYHQGDLPESDQHVKPKSIIRSIERRALERCVYTTAASPGIADAYVATYNIAPPTVVLNVFSRTDGPSKPSPSGNVFPGPTLYWFSQTIGPNRGLETAVLALSRSRSKPHLYLQGNVAVSFRDHLLDLARAAGVLHRVHFLSPIPPGSIPQNAARFDVGLVAETGETENRRISLTNKQFTYLTAGIPVLMSDTPAHRSFARDTPGCTCLFTINDPESLALGMDGWLLNTASLASARDAAWTAGQKRYNWEVEQKKLVDVVSTALNA